MPDRCPLARIQLAVLQCAADGLTSRQTAEQLGLGVDQARYQMQRILLALGVRTRVQAVAIAQRAGWILPETLPTPASQVHPTTR